MNKYYGLGISITLTLLGTALFNQHINPVTNHTIIAILFIATGITGIAKFIDYSNES